MKIAVNTRLLLKDKLEGIGWFEYETLKRITTQHPEHTFYFLFDRSYDPQFIFSSNIVPVVTHPQARHPFLYWLWLELALPNQLKKIKPDLFLSPDGFLSLDTNIPSLPVIHDINFEHYPKDIPLVTRNYYRYYFPRFARKAKRIATVSEYSKQDLVGQYGINGDLIDVVYNGANSSFSGISKELKEATKKKYSQGEEYFVFVGALHARKNIENLMLSFEQYKQTSGLKTKMIFAGKKLWWTDRMESIWQNMKYKGDVIFTGRVSTEDLKCIIGASLALTYVSNFEGFGIPIIEGFYCETPVITSNVSSMPEVAGHAALLVNPASVESIKNAMLQVALDPKLRTELISKGVERRQLFTWQKTADRLWQSIEKAIG